MRIEVRLALLDSGGQRFMGAGPLWLLEGVQRSGSIRQAAQVLGMSYAKAHRLLGRLEETLGARLLVRRIGGAERGGAHLTDAGLEFLKRYRELQDRVQAFADREFLAFSRSCEGPGRIVDQDSPTGGWDEAAAVSSAALEAEK